jgi:tetratricopeptide (TPR) repeat protein
MGENVIRIFVSSPGDAMDERRRVEAVAERLNGEFEPRLRIELVRWEESYYSAHETFQKQIPEAKDCDLVIGIFRARLGTELPPSFPKMPSGESYPSGTAYEVLSAIQKRQAGSALPDVYVFRCPTSPSVAIDDPSGPAIKADWERLKRFFDTWFCTADGKVLAAFQNFDTADEFADKIEDCLQQWFARHGLVQQQNTWDRIHNGPPYPGLVPYDSSKEAVFFGRYLDIVQAIDHLREAAKNGLPFLLLIGSSDAGKSSLMRAGVLPRLVRPGIIPEVDLWRTVLVSPGVDPLLSLATALFADGALGAELRQGDFAKPDIMAKLFTAGDTAAAARAAQLRFDGARPARLALGVDQAERLLFETDAAVADIFAKIVAALVNNNLAYAIMTLRSDAYPRFQSIAELRELRTKGVIFDVVSPGRAELMDIISQPVAACRPPLTFETADGRSVADVLVDDARGADVLPLLQMAMAKLFKAEASRNDGVLRFADYPGLGQAVSETAQDALLTLDPDARTQLTALIMALVSDVIEEPGADALTPVVAGFERTGFEHGNPARTKLVNAFIGHRLLVTEERGQALRVRAAHEALLRIWPEAVKIIRTNLAPIKVRHMLQPMVRDWAAAPQDAKAGYASLPPALLTGASQLMEVCGDDLSTDMRAYIAHALELEAARHEEEIRQRTEREHAHAVEIQAASDLRWFRRAVAGLAIVAMLAVAAAWQRYEALKQQRLAVNMMDAALLTANSLVFDVTQKFKNSGGIPLQLTQDILDQVTALQNTVQDQWNDVPALRESKAKAQAGLATTLFALGATGRALDCAKDAAQIYGELVRSAPGDNRLKLALSQANKRVGEILLAQGDLSGAYAAYSDSLAMAQKSHGLDPGNADWQHDLTETDNLLGDVLLAEGKIADAQESYESGLQVAKVPVRGDANQPRWVSDLGWSYSKLGDIDMAENNIAGALDNYTQSLGRRKSLLANDGNNVEWQHDVWMSDMKLGDAHLAEGAFDNARKVYEDGRAIIEKLAQTDASNFAWQYELSSSYRSIGEVLQGEHNPDAARVQYLSSLKIADALVQQDAQNIDWKLGQLRVNLDLAEVGDQTAMRLVLVADQLARLNSADRKVQELLERAKADRVKFAAQ